MGVSGGADSVALLILLREFRPDLPLHVVHLNHETRGEASDGDAEFVRELAASLHLDCTMARLRDVPVGAGPANASARFRAARLALFAQAVAAHSLAGVILAHHADDQAETILHRLLRGGGPAALGGIRGESRVGVLRILHPLLSIRRAALRDELVRRGIAWREDASNASPRYLRNRLRRLLAAHPALHDAMIELGRAAGDWRDWLDRAAPRLPDEFPAALLQDLPDPIAGHAARRWLRAHGTPADDLNFAALARLLAMARDAATPARQHFPGALLVRRRRNVIFAEGANTTIENGG